MGVSAATITGSGSPLRVGMTPGVLPLAVQSLTQRATRRSYVCGGMERATRAGGSADIWSERPPAPVAGVLPRLLPAVALPGWGGVLAKGGAWTERALGFGCALLLSAGSGLRLPPLHRPLAGGAASPGGCPPPWPRREPQAAPACFASRTRHRFLARLGSTSNCTYPLVLITPPRSASSPPIRSIQTSTFAQG